MKAKLIEIKNDADKRALALTVASALISLAFAIYNGALGFSYGSDWHICVFFYYLLLLAVKGILIFGKLLRNLTEKGKQALMYVSFALVFLSSLAMIGPAVIMVRNGRDYDWGLIPAITSAAYTTYSLTMAIINLSKARKIDDAFLKQIRLINFVAALMSVLVLQNTLINAQGGYDDDMRTLTAVTSGLIILFVAALIVFRFIRYRKPRLQDSDC